MFGRGNDRQRGEIPTRSTNCSTIWRHQEVGLPPRHFLPRRRRPHVSGRSKKGLGYLPIRRFVCRSVVFHQVVVFFIILEH